MLLTQWYEATVASTGLSVRLFLIEDADGARVVLHGDRDKLVFQGNAEKARAVYEGEVKRYRARRKGEPE